MTRLQLRLLGNVQAHLNGVPLRFAYAKQAALLAYLALGRGQPATRRKIGLLLWPDRAPDAVQVNLRKVISSLRKLLDAAELTPEIDSACAGGLLLSEGESLQLSPDLDLWLDVAEFQAQLVDCAAHCHRHAANCPACYAARRRACDLYAGDFMASVDLDDSDTFSAWLAHWRGSLQGQALAALQAMAEYSLQRGHLLTAQAEAQRLLQIDPLHEEGNQLVIAALAGMGQTGQALAHYEHFRRMLQRELDVTPAVETDRLAAAVRAGEMPIYGVSPLPAYAGPPLAVNPAGLEMLIGRTVEANELNAWLNDPNRRLITITGMGGVGKTRLALAVAQEQSRVFRAGVVYVPLVDVPDPAQFPAALCAAVTGRTQNDYPSLVQVAAHIGKGDLLLVLDHFDHLLEARRDLTYLLHTCPNLVVLLTSRQRLGLAAEWVFRLGGLDTPPAGMESSLADYSAAALFLHSVQQARPDLVLDSETATAVGEICRLVQGLPLALVLLAAWVRVLPCTELLQELQRSIDVVRSTRPAADDKEISLRSVLEQSWRSLRSEERAVLAGLSVFQGGFDRHAATAVAGADLDVLCCLVDHSLLQVSPEGRYSWHELVQQFCAEHLALEQQTAAASSRHFAYFLAQAEDHAAKLSAMNNLAAFLWFGCERANLEAAIVWAGSRQDLIAPGDCQRLLAVIEQAGHRKGVHNTRLDA